MKFSSLQENLKMGIFAVGHIAGKNANLPILNSILLEAKNGEIRASSTNLEIGVSAVMRGKVEKDGAVAVDAKILSEYIGLLPNQKVDTELKDNVLYLGCDKYKTKIICQSAEEFPLLPKVEKEEPFVIKSEDFRQALAQTIYAAATSEARLELSGALLAFERGELVIAATDSYRLAEKKIKIENGAKEKGKKQVIVPARTLQEIVRILSGSKDAGEIRIYLSDNQILFSFGTIELVSRLIEGQYPDYRQIIPEKSRTRISVASAELVRAVKASALFSKTGINDINLDFPKDKNKIVVSAASGQAGENLAEVDAKVSGDDNGVVINYRYLLDGLNNFGDGQIRLEVVDGNTPCVMRPEGEGESLYIIMPIKQ